MSVIHCGKFTISFDRPRIVGILNVTPDSFSDGGKFFAPAAAITHAQDMIAEGADIIDIGGESTRPGSQRISVEEELGRILPVLDVLVKELPVPISIDTTKPEVAEKCLGRGAHIINDVSGLRDSRMREVAARLKAPVIIMHMQGTPDTMQKNPQYGDVVEEIIAYLGEQATMAKSAGIEQIIIDPGIGFGKTIQHNLAILAHLGEFRILGYPVMVGVSRKSFLQKIIGDNSFCHSRENGNPESMEKTGSPIKSGMTEKYISTHQTSEATLAAEAIARYNGADMIRTHDVAGCKRAIAIAGAIRKAV
ncbi:MAG: dihydropteroate synthase [Candidatus Sungiibacteriota bacterium]